VLVQITPGRTRPRNPENPIKNKTVVPSSASTPGTALYHKRLKAGPFLVAHQTALQLASPKATLNQNWAFFGIPFVNSS